MRMKFIAIAAFFTLSLFAAPEVRAQWVHASNGLGLPTKVGITGFAVIGTNIFVGTETGIYLSTDTGSNWFPVDNGVINGYVNFIAASRTNLFADTGYLRSRVLRSTDSGTSWTTTDSGMPLNSKIHALISNGSTLFIGTDSGVFSSTNNGTSWSDASAGLTPKSANTFAMIDTNLFIGNSEGVFIANGDRSWKPVNTTLPGGAHILAGVGTNLFAVTGDSGVYLSKNRGASWVQDNYGIWMIPNSMGPQPYITSFAVSGTNIFAGSVGATDGEGGGIYLSTDKGASWGNISANFPLLFDNLNLAPVDVLALCGSYLFASIYDYTDNNYYGFPCSGVWRRPLSQMINTSAVRKNQFTTSEIQIYPNPFSKSTTISFSSPESGESEITIVNLLGTQVARVFSGEIGAGHQHEFSWDASNMPPGMYECIVRSNGQVLRTPIMLAR